MAAYNPTRGFQHIYVIVPKNPKNLRGEYFTIDPVLDRFNEEKKPFTKVHDKLMKPVSALSVGVNGFPIRMLNGGINLRSPLVYDEVLYSPSLGTWALRGVDGGYYIEGDFQRRYIEPLDGVGVGWLSTALKVGKGIFKAGKKIVKKIKRRRAEKKADKNQAKEEAQNRVANSQTDNDNIIDRMDKDTTDSIMQEFANSQVELDKKLKNLNKSTILSLQSLDKGTKEKISEVVNELSPEINKLIEEGASSKEIVQKAAQASQAILMNTNTLNKKDEERTKDIIQTVEQTARDQQAAIGKQATSQKFILIAIGALALVVVFTMIKGNKQPNI